jgi:hypothetical protein
MSNPASFFELSLQVILAAFLLPLTVTPDGAAGAPGVAAEASEAKMAIAAGTAISGARYDDFRLRIMALRIMALLVVVDIVVVDGNVRTVLP